VEAWITRLHLQQLVLAPAFFFAYIGLAMSIYLISRRLCAGLMAGALGASAPALAQSQLERGVFVSQIGDNNRADTTQQAPDASAQIVQDGNDNEATLNQQGSGAHEAQIAQDGDGNIAIADQFGDGQAALVLVQQGDRNTLDMAQNQSDASSFSVATVSQTGNDNQILLTQDGSDNQARLTQEGNNNLMTAAQTGNGNRLEWSQLGDGLSDVFVQQDGSQAMQITQSMTGAAFAPPPGGG
jgi:hypothetical protein